MSKLEAIKLMKKGIKITHRSFTSNEWMVYDFSNRIVFEDGQTARPVEFWGLRSGKAWEDGYSVWRESE